MVYLIPPLPRVFSLNGIMGREYKNFIRVWYNWHLKRETFRSRFQVIGFELKFALGC